MVPFFFLIVLTIVGLVIFAVNNQAKKAEAAWKEVGERLGLRYARKGKFGDRALRGELEGYRVKVFSFKRKSGKSSSTYTKYELLFSKESFDYRLTRAKALSGIAKFFGAQDVEIGSEEFDAGVTVKAASPKRIRDYLTPERQQAVLSILLSYPGAAVKNGEVEWEQNGLARSAAQIEGVLRRFVDMAKVMDGVAREVVAASPTVPVPAKARGGETLLAAAPAAAYPLLADRDDHEGPIYELPPVREPRALVRMHEPEERLPDPLEGSPEPEAPDPGEPDEPEEPRENRGPVEPEPEASSTLLDHTAAEVCEDLFAEGLLGSQSQKLFDEHYASCGVTWEGKLARLDGYSSDLAFGGGPGTKATVLLHELRGAYGTRKAEGVLQLAPEAARELREHVGETVRFRGKLVKCEAFLRRLYVAEAELL